MLARLSCEAFLLVGIDWRWRWHHTMLEARGIFVGAGISIGNDRCARLALALASEVMEGGGVW